MMQTQHKNGTNGKNGHSQSTDVLIREAIMKQLEELKRPGRPSKQVRELKEKLEKIGQKETKSRNIKLERTPQVEIVDAPVSKKSGRKKKEVDDEKQGRKVIYVPPIVQEVIEVSIEGISDLIQHAWDPKTIRQMEDDQQKKVGDPKTRSRNTRAPRDPDAEYIAARYIRGGKDCLPVVQFKKCMTSAASQLRGVTMKNINTAVFVKSTNKNDFNYAPLKFSGKKPELRRDMVKIGKFPNKTATPRYRPGYQNWSCVIRIEFDGSIISGEQIVNLLNRGGFGVGIAEWRPERGGEFGRFMVTSVRGVR